MLEQLCELGCVSWDVCNHCLQGILTAVSSDWQQRGKRSRCFKLCLNSRLVKYGEMCCRRWGSSTFQLQLELGANQTGLVVSQLSQSHVADNPSPCFTYGFVIPHFCMGVSLRFMSSPVSAVMFWRLGPLVCESLKSGVCSNDSTQLSLPRLHVYPAKHLFMLISASVETTCV